MSDDDAPLLDSAQEVIRFLDGYFPAYLTTAAARLRRGLPLATSGGGLGLLAMLLAREMDLTVYQWEVRPEWRALSRRWAAENGMEERLVFLPETLAGLSTDPNLQGALIEPPLYSLFENGAWWHQTRALLDWSGGRVFLPAALAVRAAAGWVPSGVGFLDPTRLEALAAHYRATLDADLSPLLEEARHQLHPRLLQQPPREDTVVTPWAATSLSLADWHAAPRRTLRLELTGAQATPVDRVFITLALAGPDGSAIGSSLFESHQRMVLVMPRTIQLPAGGRLTFEIEVTEHGFERYAVRGPDGAAMATPPPPEGAAFWPATTPRFHLADHLSMLEDRPRIDAYRQALAQRIQGGERVLDLGCGSGLLGLAALRAGAERLHAVERDSTMLDLARRILTASGVDDRATFALGVSSTLAAPAERAGLLVSEILGDKALNEGVLEYMADARERFCTPGAAVIPRRLEVFGVGCQSGSYVGHVMEGIRQHLEHDLQVSAATYQSVAPRLLTGGVARWDPASDRALTETIRIGDFDLETIHPEDAHFAHEYELQATDDGTLNSFFVWFVAHLADGVTLTNSPWEARTHWRQLRLYDFPPVAVRRGEPVHLRVFYRGELGIQLSG